MSVSSVQMIAARNSFITHRPPVSQVGKPVPRAGWHQVAGEAAARKATSIVAPDWINLVKRLKLATPSIQSPRPIDFRYHLAISVVACAPGRKPASASTESWDWD
jgi:hypothetical protein